MARFQKQNVITFGDFFAQLSEMEIDFVITHLNRTNVLGHQTFRNHAQTLDAKFIKSFVNELNVGDCGQIIVQSINNRMAV
jgi:hypothetical protein